MTTVLALITSVSPTLSARCTCRSHLQGLKLKQIPGDSKITLRPHEEQHESPFMKETLTIHVYIHHTCFLEAAS